MNAATAKLLNVLCTTFRLLTFRLSKEEFLQLDRWHLAFGLVCTWLVGVGRFWDHPSAKLFQYLGLGSVAYVFALSVFLWVIIWPLRPDNWSFFNLLTFISLVSPPAMLYAIPVERWFPVEIAARINLWFLMVVAIWRVALLWFYLMRYGGLGVEIFSATLLPLSLIVSVLTVMKLDAKVLQLMAGINSDAPAPSAEDEVNTLLRILTGMSQCLLIPLMLLYGWAISARSSRLRTKESAKKPLLQDNDAS
ncbi:MAG: hypothetical protein SF097_21740 [Acidobacteriota bacterium]|nr:hypothetical protein [Acidobacteriota bacterium]